MLNKDEGYFFHPLSICIIMKKLLLLLVLVQLYACGSSKNETEAEYSMELKEWKKITLPIDERTYFLSKSIFQFEEDGKEYLHFENSQKGMYEIVTFDLEKQDVHRRLPIQSEGPNGIPAMFGSRPYPDSKNYLIFQSTAFRISQMDGNGNVIQNYQLKSPGRFVRAMLASFCYFPSFVRDSVLYFDQPVASRKKRNLDNYPLFAGLDLRTGELGFASLYFPTTFDGDYSHISSGDRFTYDYNYNKDRLVCSFIESDSIMVTDDLSNVKWYNAKSRFLKSMTPYINDMKEDVNDIIRYEEAPKYWHLMYDKYRDVYYRFAEMPCELAKDEDPYSEFAPKAREFSVIILDKDFRIIGETKFPGNKYFYKMSFVGRDGLYISENNLANPDFDEDKLVFACFKLKDLKEKD